MKAAAHAKEALRQQMLLRALWRDARPGVLAGWMRDGERFTRGLQAYQANAGALAERALVAAYPTVQQLLGEASFAGMARAFWQQSAPQRGDIAQWGHELPAFIAQAGQLADEPYLADLAKLEWAVHQAQTAADGPLQPLGLQLLAQAAPALLSLRLQPGTCLLSSVHPIVSIWQAHRQEGADRFGAVQAAFAAGLPEHALVWRKGWAVQVTALPAADLAFTQALLRSNSLGTALDLAGPGFDFEAWFIETLQRGCPVEVSLLAPSEPSP